MIVGELSHLPGVTLWEVVEVIQQYITLQPALRVQAVDTSEVHGYGPQ